MKFQKKWTKMFSTNKHYELVNHLGNVLVVISDKKLQNCSGSTNSYYVADVMQATDYSAAGSILKGRSYVVTGDSSYFTGFQSQFRDDDIMGAGRIYSAEFWEYSSDLMRRWNVDPLFKNFAWQSTYNAFDNNPISKTDPNGDAASDGNGDPNKPTPPPKTDPPLQDKLKTPLPPLDPFKPLNPEKKTFNRVLNALWRLDALVTPADGKTTTKVKDGIVEYQKDGQGREKKKTSTPSSYVNVAPIVAGLDAVKNAASPHSIYAATTVLIATVQTISNLVTTANQVTEIASNSPKPHATYQGDHKTDSSTMIEEHWHLSGKNGFKDDSVRFIQNGKVLRTTY